MGAPYEASIEMQDISGFNSPKGKPIPNDDPGPAADLALRRGGAGNPEHHPGDPRGVLAQLHPAPLERVRHLQSQHEAGDTAALLRRVQQRDLEALQRRMDPDGNLGLPVPGLPPAGGPVRLQRRLRGPRGVRGTYAAMFVAAMESSAFVESDVRKLIDAGLSYIPENCRVARSVRLAVKCYDDGVSFRDAREAIVEDSRDLGWFQAPPTWPL